MFPLLFLCIIKADRGDKVKQIKNRLFSKILLTSIIIVLLCICSIVGVNLFQRVNDKPQPSDQIVAKSSAEQEKNNGSVDRQLVVKSDVTLAKAKKNYRAVAKIPEGKKYVALTFDDGPGYQSTQRILNTLAKYDAKATWFVLGSRAEGNPSMLKAIANAGHEINNHSYSHANLVELNSSSVVHEIESTNSIIQSIIGQTPRYLRPPYGSYNDFVATQMNIALWNVDSLDWKLKNGQAAFQQVTTTLSENPIILFHDIYDTSADAIDLLVPYLAENGYTFITYSQMMSLGGGS